MGSLPTRSPTHRDVDMARLAGLGLDLEEIADDGVVKLERLVELAEDLGRPPSHYLAGLVLASELTLDSGGGPITVTACAGKCQSWGALDCLDRAIEKWTDRRAAERPGFKLVVVQCLDRCEHAAVVVVDSPDGTVVLQQTTPAKLDEAIDGLADG